MRISLMLVALALAVLISCETNKTAADTDAGTTDANTNAVDGSTSGQAVLYMTAMFHLENRNATVSEAPVVAAEAHAIYREEILGYAAQFEAAGAKPTWEVKEGIESCVTQSDHYFSALAARGHGVGVHADLGYGYPDAYGVAELANDLQQRKSDLEMQTPTSHVSGICSDLDWVQAASNSGFDYVTGVVEWCTQSIEATAGPGESPGDYHDPYPAEFVDRLHPWRMAADDWRNADPAGEVVIIPTSVGDPRKLADDDAGNFTTEDNDLYFAALDNAIALSEVGQLNSFSTVFSVGTPMRPEELDVWLAGIKERVDNEEDDVQVVWATTDEVYEAFRAAE